MLHLAAAKLDFKGHPNERTPSIRPHVKEPMMKGHLYIGTLNLSGILMCSLQTGFTVFKYT